MHYFFILVWKTSLDDYPYPDILSPTSPSINMVWAYRDDRLINLPWNLLVEGDVIVLGPSNISPANAKQVR